MNASQPVPFDMSGGRLVRPEGAPLRLYSQSALSAGKPRVPEIDTRKPEPKNSRTAIVPTEHEPWSGSQEIRFFDDQFGLIVSELNFERDFDYEFVYEDLSFIFFRLSGQSIERISADHSPNLVKRPGFMLARPPRGHLEVSRKLSVERWHSVALFFGPDTLEKLLGLSKSKVEWIAEAFRSWQLREGALLHPFSMDMANALKAICDCPFTGTLRQTYLEAKAMELLCLVVSATNQLDSNTDDFLLSQRDRAHLAEAREILDDEFVNPPTLAELGRRVGLNRKKLAIGFRQCFDTSVMQYCLARRMEAAREMLAQGKPIAHIADAVGYADQTSFSRAFSRHHGQSPGYFRNV